MEINAKEAYEMTKKIKNSGVSNDWKHVWKYIHKARKKGKFNCTFALDEIPHISMRDFYDTMKNKGYDVTIRDNAYVFGERIIDICWDLDKEEK